MYGYVFLTAETAESAEANRGLRVLCGQYVVELASAWTS